MIARLYSTVYIMDGPVHFVDIRIQSAGLAFLGVFTRSARISLGKEEVRCNGRKLSMESSGFDSHPAKINHRPEASLAGGAVTHHVKRRQRILKPRD